MDRSTRWGIQRVVGEVFLHGELNVLRLELGTCQTKICYFKAKMHRMTLTDFLVLVFLIPFCLQIFIYNAGMVSYNGELLGSMSQPSTSQNVNW